MNKGSSGLTPYFLGRTFEVNQIRTTWEGEVEIFDLVGHPKARRCHAWGNEDGDEFRSTAVVEIPPVDSPSSAVDAAIAVKSKSSLKTVSCWFSSFVQ
jgi:hypothetical protein